jgi:uncharacterized membrane protein
LNESGNVITFQRRVTRARDAPLEQRPSRQVWTGQRCEENAVHRPPLSIAEAPDVRRMKHERKKQMEGAASKLDSQALAGARATSPLQAEHENETGWLQRVVDRLTALVGRPASVPLITTAVCLWIGANSAAPFFKLRPIDPPPFSWLQGAGALASLYIAVLILATQRRETQLADHRGQLILEMAIMAEQKSAKAIELLEESRRDNPMLVNRLDQEAQAMSTPTDHHSVLHAIKRDSARTGDDKE